MVVGRRNGSTRRSVSKCSFVHTNTTWTALGLNRALRCEIIIIIIIIIIIVVVFVVTHAGTVVYGDIRSDGNMV
jgi:hypothetical protein